MATLDFRTFDEAHRGGSDILAVGLTAAQHQAYSGSPTATATWILFSLLAETGGSVGRDRDTRVLYSEGAEREDAVDRDEGVIKGAVMQTSQRVLDLLDFLEDNEVVVKRALPLKKVAPGGETHQLWAAQRAKVDKENWTLSTARQDQRTRQFTIRTFKQDPTDAAAKPYVMRDVNLSDESTWPAALDFAKETAFGA